MGVPPESRTRSTRFKRRVRLNHFTKWPRAGEVVKTYTSLEWRTMQVICCTYYAENDLPASLKRVQPLLLDPANPWNKVAHGLRWEGLAHFAGIKLQNLENPAVGFQDRFVVQFDLEAHSSHVGSGGLTS
jgi:hypothetical protein